MNDYQYYYGIGGGTVIRVMGHTIEGWHSGVGFSVIKGMTSHELEVDYIPCTEEEAQAAIQRWDLKFKEETK